MSNAIKFRLQKYLQNEMLKQEQTGATVPEGVDPKPKEEVKEDDKFFEA